MSLPVRPLSGPQTTSPDYTPPLSVSLQGNKSMSPLKQAANLPSMTPKKEANMLQSESGSSPLSSPPSTLPKTVSPTGSSSSAQPSPPSSRTGQHTQSDKESRSTVFPGSGVTSQPSPAPETTSVPTPNSNMAAKRAPRQSAKRARQEHDEEGTPPHKKPTTKPKANPKPAARKAAPATLEKPALDQSAPKRAAPASNKAAPPPPTANNRPSRSRRAPERFWEVKEDVVKPTLKAALTKKGASKVFDPVFITTNSTSRLGKADVYHMLLEGPAWTSLSAEQQCTLISMLPQNTTNQALIDKIEAGETEDTRPQAFTMSNDCFRTDVAKFKEDLKNGHLAKTWQGAAEQAVIERAVGEYDEWKAEEAELWWGQKSK